MTIKQLDLAHLLGLEHPDDFIREYLQKRPYVLRRDDPHFYDGLGSLTDIEAFAFSMKTPESVHKRWLSLVKENEYPPVDELFNEKGIIPAQILAHYQKGYSITLFQAQRWSPSINVLCKKLEESLSTYTQPHPFGEVQAVLFLTPPGAQGFLPHYDEVDGFILQLEGSKHWSLYNQQVRFPSEALSFYKGTFGDAMQTYCLNPGDLLYIPAGYPHEATTSTGHSLHLTVALYPYKWQSVISGLVTIDEQARGSLPLHLPGTPPTTTPVEELDEVLQQMSSQQRLAAVLKKRTISHLSNQVPQADDYLHQINRLNELNLQTRLCKRYGQSYQLVGSPTQVSLYFPGNSLILPREVEPALHFILTTDEFSVGSVPQMASDEAPFDLVRRLIGSGFLKTVPPSEQEPWKIEHRNMEYGKEDKKPMVIRQKEETMAIKRLDLEHLLGLEHPDDFIREYLQKRPYVLHRDDPHFYDGLISLADVESLAFSTRTPESYNQRWLEICKGDLRPLANELFNEKGIIPAQVLAHYQQGFTLVLNRLQQHWPSINLLCKKLEEGLSTYTQPLPFGGLHAGIFLTPPGAQGFLPHYDSVDVFILQLEGSKHWSLYNQQVRFPSVPLSFSKGSLGDAMQTHCLNPGDMLYIPAGYPHEGSTNTGHSMHLTVGLNPYNWKEIISGLTTMDEQARGPLPLHLPGTPSTTTPVEQLDEVLDQMSSQQRLMAILKQRTISRLTYQVPLADDYLHQINRLNELSLQTRLCKRYGQSYQLVGSPSHLSLYFPGNSLILPREVEPALHFILTTDEFSVGTISEKVPDEASLDLVRRLIGSGFLKTVPPSEQGALENRPSEHGILEGR